MHGLEFLKTIDATPKYAASIRRLVIEDLLRAGLSAQAIQEIDIGVEKQLERLRDHPEQYSGYAKDGELVAFLKHNHLLTGDKRPFVNIWRALLSEARRRVTRNAKTGEWYVPGLVASNDLPLSVRNDVLEHLLRYAISTAWKKYCWAVNIILYDGDPITDIAERLGFSPIGKAGKAVGIPEISQRRFRFALT